MASVRQIAVANNTRVFLERLEAKRIALDESQSNLPLGKMSRLLSTLEMPLETRRQAHEILKMMVAERQNDLARIANG